MEKRYTDGQLTEILKRASELQATGGEPLHDLAAIQEIAQQVGIEPQHVADAAAALSLQNRVAGVRLLGAPATFRRSRQIPKSLSASERATLVVTIRDQMPQVGVVNEFADRLEWQSGSNDDKTAISISTVGGGTLIRADGRHVAPKLGLYAGAGVVTLVAGALGTAIWPQFGAAIAFGAFALSFGTARWLWNRFAAHSRQRLERLIETLAEQSRPRAPLSGEVDRA